MRKIWPFLLLLCLLACKAEVKTAEKPASTKYSGYFKNYLQKQFQQEIPQETHYYVIVPSKGCPSCVKKEAQDFLKLVNKPQITLIVAGSVIAALHLAPNAKTENLLIDEDNFIDRQNLPFPDFTGIYKTQNGEIMEILPFSFANYQQAFAQLPQ